MNLKLRELSRFLLSFTLSIGGFAVVFGRKIERRGGRRGYFGSGALSGAPPTILKSLNNEQISNNRALAWHSISESSAPQRNGPPQRNEPQVLCRLFNIINPYSSITIAIYIYLCILLPSSDTALFN
jgi:hypothetical protein